MKTLVSTVTDEEARQSLVQGINRLGEMIEEAVEGNVEPQVLAELVADDAADMKIRERVRMGEIKPVWIEGKKNPSDILTKAVEKAVIDTLMGQLTGREAIDGLTLRDVAKDGREFETVDALVAEIYADIVEDFEMGNFGE